MSIEKLNPYILFNGTAGEAIQLYQSALGATADVITRYDGVPGMNPPPQYKDLVLHAVIRVGGNVIMISDTTPDSPVTAAENVQICLDFANPEDMARSFDALSAGGKVTKPIHDAFWGAKFGMLRDKHGVAWMFNCATRKAA